jgi:hypothetical protein
MPEIRDTVAELLAEYGSTPDTEHLRAALGKFYDIDDGGIMIGGVPLRTALLNDLEFLPFL